MDYGDWYTGRLMDGLLHLVQRGLAWAGCGSAPSHPAKANVTAHPLHSKWLIHSSPLSGTRLLVRAHEPQCKITEIIRLIIYHVTSSHNPPFTDARLPLIHFQEPSTSSSSLLSLLQFISYKLDITVSQQSSK